MPDNDWQPSEDFLSDCKVLLRNAVRYLADLEQSRILLKVALEQFEDTSKADILDRVHALLVAYDRESEPTLDVLWIELKALSEVVQPAPITELPRGRIAFRDGSRLDLSK